MLRNRPLSIATLLFILLSFFFQTCIAQTFDKAKLDQYFSSLEENNRFMGSVSISRNDTLLYSRSTGFADVAHQIKNTVHTKFRIGSISKTFTTALIFKAVEENKLHLEDKLSVYFPEVKNAAKIDLLMLLNHRSGIHNFTDDSLYFRYNTQKKTMQDMTTIIAAYPSDFEPGTKGSYSNSNFVLLSYILEKIYKKSYANVLKDKILVPQQLKETYFGGKIDPRHAENYSYKYTDQWVKDVETDPSIPMGAGAIVSTPSDLNKFAAALFEGKIVTAEHLKLMETIKDGYGPGLFMAPFGARIGFGHTGGIDGFTSVFSYFPKDRVAYALTSNENNNFLNNNISIAVLSAVYGKPFKVPDFKIYVVKPEDLDAYIGVYSSKQIPLKISISKNGNALIAQATGQQPFTLEATEQHTFKSDAAGLSMIFNPNEKQLTLKQSGANLLFVKE